MGREIKASVAHSVDSKDRNRVQKRSRKRRGNEAESEEDLIMENVENPIARVN